MERIDTTKLEDNLDENFSIALKALEKVDASAESLMHAIPPTNPDYEVALRIYNDLNSIILDVAQSRNMLQGLR